MSGHVSDFLAAHAQRVGDVWAERVGDEVANAGDPRLFVNALLVALPADDLAPLTTYFQIDPAAADIDGRLDTVFGRLEAVIHAADAVSRDEGLDADQRLALMRNASAEVTVVGRRLMRGCVAELSRQSHSISQASSARGASLSITMHELRRPLTILNSYGQLLATGMLGAMPESAMVAIEGITASTEMMVKMVSALAELSRLEDPDDALVIEEMSASELVTGAVEHVAVEARIHEATIAVELPEQPLLLSGDRRRLTLALTNVVSNAIKHTAADSEVLIRVFTDADGIHLVVRDHGPGFPPEDAAHLFEKYYRSMVERRRKVPGSGLGLFIVRTVAERHDGRVLARSLPGEGAEFEIVLPQRGPAR